MDLGRGLIVWVATTNKHRNADGLLISAKCAGVHWWLVPFRTQVNDPALIGGTSKIFTHAGEAGSRCETGRADHRYDASWMIAMRVEHLPSRPPPEVDILVRQHVLHTSVTRFPEELYAR